MFEYMQSAEETGQLIAEIYYRASQYLSGEAQEVFEKYMSRHNLTEEEARQLLNTLQDPASIQELLEKLQGGVIPAEKAEILRVLESQAYRARIERFEQLQTQIDLVMQQVYRQEKQLQEQHYIDLAREAYYKSVFDIQQRAGVGFSFSHIDQKQIDRVINTKWSGKNYSARIWKNTQGLAQDLKQEMLLGLLTGKTEREMSLEISKKYAQGAFRSRRLVRTESSYLTNQMEMQSYQECGLDRYIYLATLDLRTCDKCCVPLDGKIFAVTDQEPGKNCPPMHPWCRCTTIAYISAEALAGMKRRARDPVTGHTYLVPGAMTYRKWYGKYVEENSEAEAKVKASRNASEDRKQFEEYKKLIGKDMPKSFADFQNLKYNEPEKWKFVKLDYQRRNDLLQHPELKLPNAENAILPEPKFTKYLFDENSVKGYPKGKAFADRLGYSIDNWQKLRDELKQGAKKYSAQYVDNNGYGDRYVQKMIIYGEKGTPANVIVAWLRKTDGTINLTSAYIKETK